MYEYEIELFLATSGPGDTTENKYSCKKNYMLPLLHKGSDIILSDVVFIRDSQIKYNAMKNCFEIKAYKFFGRYDTYETKIKLIETYKNKLLNDSWIIKSIKT